MGDGDHPFFQGEWRRGRASRDSARWRSSAGYVRRLLFSGMVVEREVPFRSGRSVFANRSGAKFGDSGWSGGKPARVSGGRDQAVVRGKRHARIPIGDARRSGAWEGPGPLCVREYDRAPEPVSNLAALRGAEHCGISPKLTHGATRVRPDRGGGLSQYLRITASTRP